MSFNHPTDQVTSEQVDLLSVLAALLLPPFGLAIVATLLL